MIKFQNQIVAQGIFLIGVNSTFLSRPAVKLVRAGAHDIHLVPSVVSGDLFDMDSIHSSEEEKKSWWPRLCLCSLLISLHIRN